jgi:hypothetical protein
MLAMKITGCDPQPSLSKRAQTHLGQIAGGRRRAVELQAAGIDAAESEKACSPCINAQAKKNPIRVPPTLDLTTNINSHDAGLLRHLGAQQARPLGERLAA